MKKRTLLSLLREKSTICREIEAGELELALGGGRKTITQNQQGEVIIVDGD